MNDTDDRGETWGGATPLLWLLLAIPFWLLAVVAAILVWG